MACDTPIPDLAFKRGDNVGLGGGFDALAVFNIRFEKAVALGGGGVICEDGHVGCVVVVIVHVFAKVVCKVVGSGIGGGVFKVDDDELAMSLVGGV